MSTVPKKALLWRNFPAWVRYTTWLALIVMFATFGFAFWIHLPAGNRQEVLHANNWEAKDRQKFDVKIPSNVIFDTGIELKELSRFVIVPNDKFNQEFDVILGDYSAGAKSKNNIYASGGIVVNSSFKKEEDIFPISKTENLKIVSSKPFEGSVFVEKPVIESKYYENYQRAKMAVDMATKLEMIATFSLMWAIIVPIGWSFYIFSKRKKSVAEEAV